MSETYFVTHQFSSSDFVESCGAVLFDLSNPSDKKVCLGNLLKKDEWVLAKGRRNINESRKDAAVREVYEETGYRCHLLPVRMATRATPVDEEADVPDEPRVHADITEPFMCTVRQLPNNKGVKIIWWFIAVLDELEATGPGEEKFKPQFFPCDEAIGKLYFELDRAVLRKAMQIVDDTLASET